MFGLIPFRTHNTNEIGGTFADLMSDFFNDDFFHLWKLQVNLVQI